MLTKRELDEFFETVPPHHNTEIVKARKVFDLMNTEPRQIADLAGKTDQAWNSVKRFLSEGRYAEFVEQVGSIEPKLWALRETAIRLKISGYDAEVAEGKLITARDENSPGHLFDPVPKTWFTVRHLFFPFPPIFNTEKYWDEDEGEKPEATILGANTWGVEYPGQEGKYLTPRRIEVPGKSERWPLLNQYICFDPFFTVCYILTNARGNFKVKLRKALDNCEDIHNNTVLEMNSSALNYDVMLWSWAYLNLLRKNYTFFERDFSYLPSLWTGHVREEYSLHYSRNFIKEYIRRGPVEAVVTSFGDETIEAKHEQW